MSRPPSQETHFQATAKIDSDLDEEEDRTSNTAQQQQQQHRRRRRRPVFGCTGTKTSSEKQKQEYTDRTVGENVSNSTEHGTRTLCNYFETGTYSTSSNAIENTTSDIYTQWKHLRYLLMSCGKQSVWIDFILFYSLLLGIITNH